MMFIDVPGAHEPLVTGSIPVAATNFPPHHPRRKRAKQFAGISLRWIIVILLPI